MATALPAASAFTGATVTEADFKSAITDLRAYLAGLHGTDGEIATALDTLGVPLSAYLAKSGTYTVVAPDDRGTLFACSGTWSLGLPAAATAGAGFAIGVRNTGSGTITIDPNLSETIDGATTLALSAAQSALVVCTGSAWLTVGSQVSALAAASQAEMEAGTSTTTYASPGRLKYDPGMAKAWALVTDSVPSSNPVAYTGHNVSALSRVAEGRYSLTWTTAFSATPCVIAAPYGSLSISGVTAHVYSASTTGCEIRVYNGASLIDRSFTVAVYGDYA